MKDILDKITSYNLFNYLLPGILFTVIIDNFTTYSFIQKDIILGAFIYYFIGLVISRFGSLIVEPILIKISFIKFIDYKDYILASKKDATIGILSETGNMYRTFTSMFLLVFLVKLYEWFEYKFFLVQSNFFFLILLLFIIFLYSYKKQTDYITERVKSNNQ